MPLREVEKIYTKSELALIGWRSQEVSANFQKKQPGEAPSVAPQPNMPKTKKSELGSHDLRQLTGDQLRRHFAGLGLVLPMMVPGS